MAKKNRLEIYIRAIEFMKEHVYGKISIREIAEHCGISSSGLQKDFQRFADSGVMMFYLDLKIAEAKKLLRQGERMTEVAQKLQYSSLPHFSAAFKKRCGVTPSKYQSEHRVKK